MTLLLVQHGDSLAEQADPSRPLSPRGRRDVEDLANALAGYHGGDPPTEVLHSGKLRAEQTAEVIAEAIGVPARAVAGLNPLEPVGPVASDFEKREQSAVIVGHLPFLERLASFLIADREEPSVVSFQRGGAICLQRREPRVWTVLWTFMPDQPRAGGSSRAWGGSSRQEKGDAR